MNALHDYVRTRRAEDSAAIATAVNADRRTAAPIPLDRLGPLLRKLGIMAALKQLVVDAATPAALRAGISDFLDQLADVRQANLDTTDPVIAARSAAILDDLRPLVQQLGQDPDAVIAAIYVLGGGFVFDRTDFTAADVDAAKGLLDRSDAIEALWTTAVAEHTAAVALHQLRNSKLADLRNDPALPVPATLAELDATAPLVAPQPGAGGGA